MQLWRNWRYRLPLLWRSLARRQQADEQLHEEFAFHVAMETEANVARGMSPQEAYWAARQSLRDMEQYREACRDARGLGWLDGWGQDMRHAVRSLRKSPVFTLVALFSLALGIGANSALFSVADAVWLRSVPLPQLDRLIVIQESRQGRTTQSNPARLHDWQARLSTLQSVFGYYSEALVLPTETGPVACNALRVAGNTLGVFGLTPAVGRAFTEAESLGTGAAVALLTQRGWHRYTNGSSQALGRVLRLSGTAYTVIGILPERFAYPEETDVVIPMSADTQATSRRAGFFSPIGRLQDGVTIRQVQAELDAVAGRLAAEYPDSDKDLTAQAIPLQEEVRRDARTPLLALLCTLGTVLLIACVNLAGLLLGRALLRQREAAIRVALGAGRGRLIRLFVTESLLLALGGAAIGLAVASAGLDVLKRLLPAGLPHLTEAALDWRVVIFAVGVALLCGLMAGLVPAWHAARGSHAVGLKEGAAATSGARRRSLLPVLVVVEVTLSLVLLVQAGLLARTFFGLTSQPLGFQPDRVMTVAIHFSWDTPPAKLESFYGQALERFAAIPGARAVGMADRLPLQGGSQSTRFALRHRPLAPSQSADQVSLRAVSAGYFAAIGIPLKAGEFLQPAGEGAPRTTVVNEAFARQYFGTESPVGQYVTFQPPRLDGTGPAPVWSRITGVVGDVRQEGTRPVSPEAFVLTRHTYWPMASFVLRAQGEPLALTSAVREAVRQIDPNQIIHRIGTLEGEVDQAHAVPRLRFWVMGGFAAVALFLAVIGVYGVLAQEVAQRTQEIGVRMALGARPQEVLRQALGRGLRLALAGLLLGLPAALAVARLLSGLLYGVTPTDLAALLGAAAVLLAAGLLASYIPARRAARVDPLVALRHE